jgi:hypothetical protein
MPAMRILRRRERQRAEALARLLLALDRLAAETRGAPQHASVGTLR